MPSVFFRENAEERLAFRMPWIGWAGAIVL